MDMRPRPMQEKPMARPMTPPMQMLRPAPAPQTAVMQEVLRRPPIGEDEIEQAEKDLREYKAGKANLEQRIKADDLWWHMRHFELMDRKEYGEEYPSAWLFNSIMGKHAALMENYPEPNILPREKGDEQEAKTLTSIIPVVLEHNDFKETYSHVMWRKVQHGTGAYAVTWDASKINGLGDVSILPINVLNLFWEPGVRDIQLSRNIFHVELVHEEILKQRYPDTDLGKSGDGISITEFATEDNIDKTGLRMVVDWYYKRNVGGVVQLHLCKFVGRTILYSSENEGEPWYDDGQYPFVLDIMFPMEGSPAGFGFIDTGKHAQEQIDLLNQAIITNALMNSRPRYFQGGNSHVNKEQFADWREQLVDVKGTLSDINIQAIAKTGLDGVYVQVLESKIGELKETTSNQDVQTGSSGGATAASAIQALQESAGMPMKDATRGTYRAFEEVVRMVISRIRQFYDMPRMFRIMGEYGAAEFVPYDNRNLQVQPIMGMYGAVEGYRQPEFDIEVVAQAETQYTKLKNNEDIINLYGMGFFNPENADVALMVMDMLDMPRKDKIIQHIEQYRTINDRLMQYMQLSLALAGKYDPRMAMMIQQMMQQDMMTMPGMAGGAQMQGQPPKQTPGQQRMQLPGAQQTAMQGMGGKSQPGREAATRARAQNTTRPGM